MLAFLTTLGWAQKGTLQGHVTAENHTALNGAHVRLEGTNRGSTTNASGFYSLPDVKAGHYTVIISYEGMRRTKKEVTISEGTVTMDLMMAPRSVALGEVVVTGTYTPHHLKNAPIQTEVYNARDIMKVRATNFSEAIERLCPGFNVAPTIMGTNMQVNGLSNDFVLILVNGQRVAGDISGNTDLSRISTENIASIEVVKGAASSLYGSDAMGAVINIITKKPVHAVEATIDNTLSDNGEWTNSESLLLNMGRIKSVTNFSRSQTDGYKLSDYELKKGKQVPTDKRVVNASIGLTADEHLSWQVNDKLEVYGRGGFYQKSLFRPKTAYQYGYTYDDVNFGAGLKYLMGKKNHLTVDYHDDTYSYSKVYNQSYKGHQIDEEELSKRQRYQELRSRMNWHAGHHLVTVGAGAVNKRLESPYLSHTDDETTGSETVAEYNMNAQDEWSVCKQFTLVAGARYDYSNQFGSAVTPKVALLYKPGNFRLRANYARGYKTPTLLELYYNYISSRGTMSVGNSSLTPQLSDYLGFTTEYRNNSCSFSATLYHNQLYDMIYLDNINSTITAEEEAQGVTKKYRYENMGEAVTQGIDLNMTWQAGHGFYAGCGYSYVDARGRMNKDDEMERLEKVSYHTARANGGWLHQFNRYRLNIHLNGQYDSGKYFGDGNARAYQLWDFITNHTLTSLGSVELQATAGIRNLFNMVDDSPFGSHYGTLDSGRRIFAGLKIRFIK